MMIKDCLDYLDCVSSLLKFPQNFASQDGSSLVRLQATISKFTNVIVVPFIGMFGILGNSLNLLVLTRKLTRCSSIERSYNSGLVALAAADLAICFLYFLKYTMNFNSLMGPKDSTVPAYFSAYVQPIINVSIFASTWFTTAVAISRYVAICHPLHTRSFVNLRVVRTCTIVILACAVIVNLPRFLHYRVVTSQCGDLFKHEVAGAVGSSNLSSSSSSAEKQSLFNASCDPKSMTDTAQFYEINKHFVDSCSCTYSHKHTYLLFDDPTFKSTYNSMTTLVTTVIPLAIMIFCNVCFVKALRHSFAMRSVFRSQSECSSSHGNTISCSAYCPTDMATVTRVKDGLTEDEREDSRVTEVKGSFTCKSRGFSSQKKMLEIQESFAKSSALRSDEFLTKNLPGHENQGQESIESKSADSPQGNNFGKKPLLVSGKPKVVFFRLNKRDSMPNTGAPFRETKDGKRIRSRPRSPKHATDDHYITPTLIAIIIFFVLLVTPSELLGIVQNYVITEKDKTSFVGLNLAVDITNCFHLLNFSINAVLYSIINVKFRRTVKKLLCYFNCCRRSRPSRRCSRKRSGADTDGDSGNTGNTGINKMQMTSAVGN